MRSIYTALSILALFVAVTLGVSHWQTADAGSQQAASEIESQFVNSAPVLDGSAEAMWDDVPAITVAAFGGANAGNHEITLKSVYTNDAVHFLVQWTDATHSLQRFPWVKQEDGTWLHLNDGSDHDENLYYEDKFAFIWNINNSINGFNEGQGCFATCHVGDAGKPYGNKFTQTAGELGDIWHWKSVRSNPEGYIDDQYVDDARWSEDNTGAGRHSDARDSGGYVNNVNEDATGPTFMAPSGANGNYWIHESEKVEFVDTFTAGDEIAGIIVEKPTGDRGDIAAKGAYADGVWTLEMSRPLVTGSDTDIQFDDLGQGYYFGMAVFDNSQVRHSFQAGVSMLTFGPGATAAVPNTWGQIKADIDR